MIEVTIKPEDINAQVAQAVIDSALGAEVKKAVEEVFKERYRTGNIIETAVKNAVITVVQRHAIALVNDREEQIKALVTAALTEEIMTKIVSLAIDKFAQARYS